MYPGIWRSDGTSDLQQYQSTPSVLKTKKPCMRCVAVTVNLAQGLVPCPSPLHPAAPGCHVPVCVFFCFACVSIWRLARNWVCFIFFMCVDFKVFQPTPTSTVTHMCIFAFGWLIIYVPPKCFQKKGHITQYYKPLSGPWLLSQFFSVFGECMIV